MAGYSGRRAPNFSQYLEDLNAVPSPYEQSVRQQDDTFNLDAELAMFTNTEFLDFDNFSNLPLSFDAIRDEKSQSQNNNNTSSNKASATDYLDFLNPDSSLSDLVPTTFITNTAETDHSSSLPPASPISKTTFNGSSLLETGSNVAPTPPQQADSMTRPVTPSVGAKRKPALDAKNPDEAARLAAEEDKRRRNTAASARFRIKKKQREQALERTVKEATEKNAVLEARVSQLELENQWLKNLVTEKKGEGSREGKSELDIAMMFKKFLATHKSGQRSPSTSKSGVGTSA